MDVETRDPAALWAVFNLETGEIVERLAAMAQRPQLT